MTRDQVIGVAARIGFGARGLLYATIGVLAFRGRAEDPKGAMAYANDAVGAPILIALAAGLLAYGVWRLIEAYTDTEGRGREAKGLLVRAGGAVIGFIYFGFAYSAVRIAAHEGSFRKGAEARSGAETALSLPGGRFLLLAAAAGFVAAGAVQIWKAYKLGFLRRLTQRAARSSLVKWCGRIGLAGRAIVFLGIALLVFRAVQHMNPGEAGGSGDALATMPIAVRAPTGVALILFGIVSLIQGAFWRADRDGR